MCSNVHPTFAPFLASIAPPPSEADRIAADLERNKDKAQILNLADELAAMKAQIQNNPEHWGIA